MNVIRGRAFVATLVLVLTMVLAACDRSDVLQLSAGVGAPDDQPSAKQASVPRADASGKDTDASTRDAKHDQEPEEPSTADAASSADGGYDASTGAATVAGDTSDTTDVDNAGSQSTSVAQAVPSQVLWSATHERETVGEEWGGARGSDDAPGPGGGGLYNSGIRSFELSTQQARSGSHSLKTIIDTVDASGSKENKAAVRAFRWAESESHRDLYFSVWYYIPQHVRPTYFWNVFQFKSKVLDANNKTLTSDPIWTINIDNRDRTDSMYVYLYYHGKYFTNGSNRRYEQSAMNIPVGRWFNLEARLVQSTGRNADGRLTMWQDGELLWDIRNVRTRHGLRDISRAAEVEQSWSANNYSNGLRPSVATIYLDDAAISRSRIWYN